MQVAHAIVIVIKTVQKIELEFEKQKFGQLSVISQFANRYILPQVRQIRYEFDC